MASGGWQEKSGQWPAKQAEASGGVRKAPNEPNWNRPLIVCAERVNIDVFGLVYAERSHFHGSFTFLAILRQAGRLVRVKARFNDGGLRVPTEAMLCPIACFIF